VGRLRDMLRGGRKDEPGDDEAPVPAPVPGVAGIDPVLRQNLPDGPIVPPQEAVAEADPEVDEHLARLAKLSREKGE
jgi:hypothetical protein